jgi:hypothetical protein
MSKLIKFVIDPDGFKTKVVVGDISVHTNLDCDCGHWVFPDEFISVPEIGDYVCSTSGARLKVCARYFNTDGSITIEVTRMA